MPATRMYRPLISVLRKLKRGVHSSSLLSYECWARAASRHSCTSVHRYEEELMQGILFTCVHIDWWRSTQGRLGEQMPVPRVIFKQLPYNMGPK